VRRRAGMPAGINDKIGDDNPQPDEGRIAGVGGLDLRP